LRDLLPRGGLTRGSVVTVPGSGLLSLALAAGASADGAWCVVAGIPEAGLVAAAGLGLDPDRTLLVPDLGSAWPQVVASLLDGRGEAARARSRWLWLPAEDGTVAVADPAEIPDQIIGEPAASGAPALRVVNGQ